MMPQLLNTLLLFSVLLPLLLALPVIRKQLPQQSFINPACLSLLPAAALLLLTNNASLELPWLFFGSGLAMDNNNRWLVGMLVVIWFSFTCLNDSDIQQSTSHETFLLLCLATSMATVLSVDLLGFFIFSSIMGYTFYAVLFHLNERHIKASGLLYIICLVLADIALFDALLIAEHTGESFEFDIVQISMEDISAHQFYVFMAFIGFALRAAIWPLHFWLTRSFNSIEARHAFILPVIPVAIAMLGLIRWLPVEQGYNETLGLLLKLTGFIGIAYALLRLLSGSALKLWAAWATIIYSGSFIFLLGLFLSSVNLWVMYEVFVYAYIALGSLLVAVICYLLPQQAEDSSTDRLANSLHAIEQHLLTFLAKLKQLNHEAMETIETGWRLWRKGFLNKFQMLLYAKHSSSDINDWPMRISLLAILGLLVAWLG